MDHELLLFIGRSSVGFVSCDSCDFCGAWRCKKVGVGFLMHSFTAASVGGIRGIFLGYLSARIPVITNFLVAHDSLHCFVAASLISWRGSFEA